MSNRAAVTESTISFGHGYFRHAFEDVDSLIGNAEFQFKVQKIEFDSMVGIGLSGLLVLPILARHFDVPFMALRKPNVESHDSYYGTGQYGRGTIGKRWILVDDFVSTGSTMRKAQQRIADGIAESGFKFETEFVGTYCYGNEGGDTVGTFVYPDSTKKSLMPIEVDGETKIVDFRLFRSMKDELQYYRTRNRSETDPKGAAIKSIRSYWSTNVTLDELAMVAVAAERELEAGNTRFV